jgi:tetratricopeptide (TPR) repeat protein
LVITIRKGSIATEQGADAPDFNQGWISWGLKEMMKTKNKVIPVVMVALIGFCIFAPIVSAGITERWNEKCIGFEKSGEYEKAIECFDRIIVLNPNLGIVYYNRGVNYCFLKQYERAMEDFDKAIELNPNLAEAYAGRGNTYAQLEQYEIAIEDFDKAIELNPNLAEAYCNRGIVYSYLKEYERAIEDFDKAIELNPNLAEAYYNRGAAYFF